eukprot:2764787-Rhodomonas_salina.2
MTLESRPSKVTGRVSRAEKVQDERAGQKRSREGGRERVERERTEAESGSFSSSTPPFTPHLTPSHPIPSSAYSSSARR